MSNASGRETTKRNSPFVIFSSTTGRSLFATLLISFATFNIRGLGHCDDSENIHSKREQLGSDCLRYGIDICAIQETKVVDRGSCRLSNGYRLGLSRDIAVTMGSVLLSVPVLLIMWYDGHVSVIEFAFWTLNFLKNLGIYSDVGWSMFMAHTRNLPKIISNC